MSDAKNVTITNENLKLLIDTIVTRVNDNTDKKYSELKSDVVELKSDVSILKSDVSVLKTDVSVLKTDVSVLKTDVSVLKTDVSVLKTDVKRIETKVDTALNKQNKYDDTFHNIGQLVNNI